MSAAEEVQGLSVHTSAVVVAMSLPLCAILCCVRVLCMILHDMQTTNKHRKHEERRAPQTPSRCWCCSALLPPTVGASENCQRCGAVVFEAIRTRGVFDECVFRGPCRAFGRYGRMMSLFTAAVIFYCIEENVRLLLPTLLALVGPQSTAGTCLRALSVYLSCVTLFNFVATMCTSPGYVRRLARAHTVAALATALVRGLLTVVCALSVSVCRTGEQ